MIKLKRKIHIINSLPEENKKKKFTLISFLSILLASAIIFLIAFIIFNNILPIINSVKIEKIVGKKTYITSCNTKDYIIIGMDKNYTMSLTNNECKADYYEGTLTIKNNEVYFDNTIKGLINSDYNILINNHLFESEDNE